MKNKNGFISMSLVYSFLILFLFLITATLTSYMQKNTYLNAINQKISNDIDSSKKYYKTLYNTILTENVSTKYEDVNVSGLFYTDISNERMYFFRGKVDNNYVIYGSELKESEVKNICWKILGTNEDGSIRLVYYGNYDSTDGCKQETINTSIVYGNTSNGLYYEVYKDNDDNYVVNNSTLKATIDEWFRYKTNLLYEFDEENSTDLTTTSDESKGLANSYFCNDVFSDTSNININTFKCTNKLKLIDLVSGIGTGLKYNVGTLTYIDVIKSGLGTIGESFLEYGSKYWTMTSKDTTNVYEVASTNTSDTSDTSNTSNVYKVTSTDTSDTSNFLPVINIKQKSTFVSSGNGLASSPYKVEWKDVEE